MEDDEIIICEHCYAENDYSATHCSECGNELYTEIEKQIINKAENIKGNNTKIKQPKVIPNNKVTDFQRDALHNNVYNEGFTKDLSKEDISRLIEAEKLNNLTTIKKILNFFRVLAIISIIAGIILGLSTLA